MTKRLLLVLSALMAALCLLAPCALAETEGHYTYTVTDGQATITDYNYYYNGSYNYYPVVPETLGGYPVTAIGRSAFANESIYSVTLPDTVATIGDRAFYYCSSLRSVDLGNSVTSIGDYAFYYCNSSSFTSITIPDSVTTIGSRAFDHCTYLTSIELSSSLTSVGTDAFYYCSKLDHVYLDSLADRFDVTFANVYADPMYYAENLYVGSELITEAIIPDGVNEIGSYALRNCKMITSVVLPDSVTAIGDHAFDGCSGLKAITVGSGLTSVGSNALYNCKAAFHASTDTASALTLSQAGYAFRDTNYPDLELKQSAIGQLTAAKYTGSETAYALPESVTEIGSYAFSENTNLISITIPGTVTTISNHAFFDCSGLTAITIPDSVSVIENDAFYGCSSLISVSLGTGLSSIGSYAFYGCNKLSKADIATLDAWLAIQFEDHRGNPLYYADNLFVGGKLLTDLVIPEGTESVNDYAFYTYAALASVTVKDAATAIGESAFYNCPSLSSVVLPEGMTTIGESAFYNCPATLYAAVGTPLAEALARSGHEFTDPQYPNLSFGYNSSYGLSVTGYIGSPTAVVIPEGVTYISPSAFYGCTTLTSVTFPDSLKSIGKEAFENCSKLASVTLGSGLTSTGSEAFYNCQKLKKVYAPTIEAWMQIQFGNWSATPMYYADDLYIGGSPLTHLVIPEGTTAIDANRFQNCKSLSIVELPASLTSIGDSAFSSCENVKEVHIPTLDAWLGIALGGYGSNPLRASNAENRTLYIGGKPLEHLVIPEGTTAIDAYRFHSCTTLVSVDFPDTLESVGYEAFEGCWNLKSVTLPESVHTIEGYAFSCGENCEITLPDNVTKIGNYAFGYNSIAIVNPDSVTFATLSDLGSEFRYCDKNGGEWVYQRKGDGSLYASGYRGKATELTFPDNVTGIAIHFDDYMPNRDLVTTIRIPENITHIGGNAFIDCNYLTELYLPDNIEEIDMWPFDMDTEDGKGLTIYCTKGSLTSKALGTQDYAFCDLTEPDWLWQYDENETLMLGGYCGSATSITLPAGVTAIADNAFDHDRDEKLVSITIPEGYESIGKYAFDCNNLAHISLPSTLRSIGDYAFWGFEITSIQLPEGLETIGTEAFRACHDLTSLTIPSTVTNIPDAIVWSCDSLTTVVLPAEIEYIAPGAFGESLSTVYCYRDTYAQEWAKDNAPLVRLIGEGTIEDLVKLTFDDRYGDEVEYTVFEVGMTTAFMRGVSVGTLPLGANYTFTCTSSDPSVARVDGDILTFLKPGKAEITIAIAERPDVAPLKRTLEVYNPVTSFTVPEAIFVHIDTDDPTFLIPENIEPAADANPYFRRTNANGDTWEWCNVKEHLSYRDKGVYFTPEERLGAKKCEIESFSGVKQPILFVTYDKIGEVYANPPARPLVIGQIWEPDVTVMVDGAELEKLSYLYTLKTSNAKVAAITEDEMIRAVAPGTATITVTARNSGRMAKFTVTVTEAVTLNLPASLKAVSDESFVGMAASEIIIPDGCVSIGARAFADCANLTDVTIPASVTEIAEDAFAGCSGVTITTPASSAAAQMFGGMDGFTVMTE